MGASGNEVTALSLVGKLGLGDWAVVAVTILVEDVSVSVGEGTALNILTRDTHVVSLINEGGEGKSLSGTPVDAVSFSDGTEALLEDLDDVWMELAISWELRDLLTNLLKGILLNTSEGGEIIILDAGPLLSHPVLLLELKILTLGVGILHLAASGNLNILEALFWDTLLDKLSTVEVSNWLVLLNDLVHHWLGEGWLIQLIVTEFTVTDQVNDDVLHELLAELSSEFEGTLHILHRVSVDVEDWRVDRLSNVRGVLTRATLVWSSGETNLVIDDDVDSAANSVVGQRLHLDLLEDDALPGHGSVTVHDDWHDGLSVLGSAAKGVLLGAGSSHNDWVDGLQVGWVSQKSHGDINQITIRFGLRSSVTSTQVILDITSVLELLWVGGLSGWKGALELGHDDLHWLTDDVGQHVESTSVWHTNNKVSGTVVNSGVDGDLDTWNEGLATLETESLHGVELGGQEGAEVVGPVKSVVQV